MSLNELRAAVLALPPDERALLAGELWDSVDDDDLLPTTSELMAELERRDANLTANPESARPWDEVYARLKARYGG